MANIIASIWRGKQSLLISISVLINIVLIFFVSGVFDLTTAIVYLATGILLARIIKIEKATTFFIVGAFIPVAYNGIGMMLGAFTTTGMFMIKAALTQGFVTWAVAKMHGVQ